MTAYAQQYALLLEKTTQPNPRRQVLSDLKELVQEKRNQGNAIVIMIDANEEGQSPASELRSTMDELDLTNLHHHLHGTTCPKTYIRGSSQIDHIYGCPIIVKYTTKAGILPFKFGIDSDHRGLYVDIEVDNIFRSSTMELKELPNRKLSSKNKKHATKFCNILTKSCKNQRILTRLANLMQVPPDRWTDDHTKALNNLDTTFSSLILTSETKACHAPYGYAISEKLIQAGQLLRYWKTQLSQLKNPSHNLRRVIHNLGELLELPYQREQFSQNDITTSIDQAKAKLKEIQRNARQHREEWLQTKAQEAAEHNNTTLESELKQLNQREQNKRIFRNIARDITKTERSAVYFIEVPDDGLPPRQSRHWKEIRNADDIHAQLLQYSEQHYRLAQSTPFGNNDRGRHLGFTGTGIIAQEILQQEYTYNLDDLHEEAKQFIKQLHRKDCPTMKTNISTEEVYKLFHNWNEQTSTSPSGIHLGLYKAMVEEEYLCQVITYMMNLTVKHGITLTRWERSTMCMIEKDRGSPKVHRLRLIHLFEADMNGLAKIIWARRFIRHCQKYKLLHHSQHGGLPGRETQQVLLKFRMTTDSAMIMRHNLAIMNNDAEACYDRIIPAINGIAHMAKGMPENAIKVQNKLLQNMKYYVRTAHGCSQEYWDNEEYDPKFGLGQGGGWSPSGWASISSDMLHTHEKQTTSGMSIRHVTQQEEKSSYRTIDAFVDDANNGVNDGDQQEDQEYQRLLEQLQQSSQSWERILQITGGNLNLLKCFCSVLSWKWQNDKPIPTSIHELPTANLKIVNSSTNEEACIQRLESNNAFKLLGVWVQLQGNMDKQYQVLQEKIYSLTRAIKSSNLSYREAMTAYKSVAFKKIEYCLPMTTFSIDELERLQQPFTKAFIASSGYHSKIPRAIIYGPERYGGIGLNHLGYTRGILQLKYIIGHVRMQDELGKQFLAVLSQLQITAGVSWDIMKYPSASLPHLPICLFQRVREFLSLFGGSLEITDNWIPATKRENDVLLMDMVLQTISSPIRIQRFNACRMYLRVQTLSDICNASGTRIRKNIYEGQVTSLTSKLLWPRQQYPSNKCWEAWRKLLKDAFLIDESQGKRLEINRHLGKWIETPDIIHQELIDVKTEELFVKRAHHESFNVYNKINRTRTKFSTRIKKTSNLPDQYIPVTTENNGEYFRVIYSDFEDIIQQDQEYNTFHRYLESLHQSTRDMIHHVTKVVDIDDICEVLTSGQTVTIASDGSKKKVGGTYAWIAESQSKGTILEGLGTVHGMISTQTSHRAELYGMTAAHEYLYQICKYFNIKESTSKVHLICDNEECVDKLKHATEKKHGLKRYMSADYDVESRLIYILERVPYKSTTEWVKGHQDETDEDLDHYATLNIAADELAEYAYSICNPSQEVFPPFQSTNISLLIENKRITSKMTKCIQDALHLPAMKKYRKDKYKWGDHVWDTIDWDAYSMATKSILPGMRRFLHRYTCEWLPVGNRIKHFMPHRDPRCPSCQEPEDETCYHIFQCQNQRRKQMLIERILLAMNILLKRNTYKKIVYSIQQNIINWVNAEEEYIPKDTNEEALHDRILLQAIQEQNEIGWEHMTKGWISTKWSEAQHEYYQYQRQQGHKIESKWNNGTAWSKILVQVLQQISYDTWMFRNKDIYGHSQKEQNENEKKMIHRQIRYEYNKRFTYSTRIQWRYFTRTITDRLKDSSIQLKSWYENLKQAIRSSEEREFT